MLDLAIDRGAAEPLFRQLHTAIRDLIVRGVLPAHTRLPATRRLATRLSLARASVVAAYEQLLAEGFIVARAGSGTYVAEQVSPTPPPPRGEAPAAQVRSPALSAYARRLSRFDWRQASFEDLPFNAGRCGMDARTLDAWRRLTVQTMRGFDRMHLGYSDPRGTPALREAVVEYLRIARAVRCEPDQVMIVGGAHHAIDLALRILIDPGDAAWIEDPGYPGFHAALAASGARIVPVPADEHGLCVSQGIATAPDAKLAYVTPSNQFPLGGVLSMERRHQLLAWARQTGAWIIEDDYDSEFRYLGRPLASLQGIDPDNRVIYVGTFSKVLLPGLRIGYAVIPPALLDIFMRARYFADRHPPTPEQMTLAAFIKEGFFASHIARMRLMYRDARDALVSAIDERLPGLVEAACPDHGLQVLARLDGGLSDTAVAAAALRHRIVTRPVSPMYLRAPPVPALLLGFSGHRPDRLRRAVDSLALVIESEADRAPRRDRLRQWESDGRHRGDEPMSG
ncbi:PLP-dependent aminotransferase family protein [Rhodopila sp.]|jgi:GntR family transcriptional regulator/MocR family aminotransferase|uniref:MocR-like pyridoxine biosynthesis transcription factor PdxR n=1 Tax=Rhodopila sp. TaxID=2480087 RepID=UPI002D810B33|nr:PLP-dependent aminotransferase family protein [Rhodopila sp.]